jgi:hypothetical protein
MLTSVADTKSSAAINPILLSVLFTVARAIDARFGLRFQPVNATHYSEVIT